MFAVYYSIGLSEMRVLKVFVLFFILSFCSVFAAVDSLHFDWNNVAKRKWVGEDFWANRLQDWSVDEHRVNCLRPGVNSTLHMLSAELKGDFALEGSITLGRNKVAVGDSGARSGLLLGLSDTALNYLARSTMQHFFLKENGVYIGIDERHRLFIEELSSKASVHSKALSPAYIQQMLTKGISLQFSIKSKGDSMLVSLSLKDGGGKSIELLLPSGIIGGNIAFVASAQNYLSKYFFDDFNIGGTALARRDDRKFGPISTCLYSLDANVLNLSVQFLPIGIQYGDSAAIEINRSGQWQGFKTIAIDSIYGLALLRNHIWDDVVARRYRVRLKRDKTFEGDYYYGQIAMPASTENKLKIAVLSCNGMPFIERSGMDYWQIWKPYELSAKRCAIEKPELLVFLGDQMYESRPVPMEWDKTLYALDYQYRWLLWCMQFNPLTSSLPTLVMMDDHDYFQGNLWGVNGDTLSRTSAKDKPINYAGDAADWLMENGGFFQDLALLKYAVALQTAHLPTSCSKQNTAVPDYYTVLKFKGVGLAILEDRKYKSAPMKALPNVASFNGFPHNDSLSVDSLDNIDAQLLNEDQLQMLDKWSEDWNNESMKVVFTQSVYSCLSASRKGFNPLSGKNIVIDEKIDFPTRLAKDMDSNGWPKSGRDKALQTIRRSGALLVGGDQHFPSVVQQGIARWKDAVYSFTVPAVSSTYPRFWYPDSTDHCGDNNYLDGFGNKFSMQAYSNPVKNDSFPLWMQNAPGIAFVTCDKQKQSYTLDCWDFEHDTKQYPGWPITVRVADNIYASSFFETPVVMVKKVKLPLISVIDMENNQFLYALRINNQSLKVPHDGKYKLIIELDNGRKKEVLVKTGKGKVLLR